MYPLLRFRDRLPTVTALQILLNRKIHRGTFIEIDGIFGPRTRKMVRDFQTERILNPDGVVGENTWRELKRNENLVVIDTLDVTDPKDMGYEDSAIRGSGGTPIVNFGMCNGVKHVMREIQSRSGVGNVVLLRFHGHGAPGVMGLTVGTGAEISSEFGVTFLNSLARYLSRYALIFSSFGSVELHGCRVGAGTDGRRLVKALAQSWQVPVTAGLRSQYGGGGSTFRFEGPTVTAFPSGGNLKGWSASRPVAEVHGMSVSR